MAWSYYYPQATQNQKTTTQWNTFRNIRGTVQMRITDLSYLDGRVWESLYFHVALETSSNAWKADGTLHKTWGVTPGFVTIGYVNPGESLRLQTYFETGEWAYPAAHWTSQLRCLDNF